MLLRFNLRWRQKHKQPGGSEPVAKTGRESLHKRFWFISNKSQNVTGPHSVTSHLSPHLNKDKPPAQNYVDTRLSTRFRGLPVGIHADWVTSEGSTWCWVMVLPGMPPCSPDTLEQGTGLRRYVCWIHLQFHYMKLQLHKNPTIPTSAEPATKSGEETSRTWVRVGWRDTEGPADNLPTANVLVHNGCKASEVDGSSSSRSNTPTYTHKTEVHRKTRSGLDTVCYTTIEFILAITGIHRLINWDIEAVYDVIVVM